MLSPEQRSETLHHLAVAITRAGWRTPVALALDAFLPLAFLSSQLALFARPFTMGSSWEQYALALTDEASWQELSTLLARQEC